MSSQNPGRPRILVVEQDAAQRELICKTLSARHEDGGFGEVVAVATGAQCLGMTWTRNNSKLIKRDVIKLMKEFTHDEIVIRNNPLNCRNHITVSDIYFEVAQSILEKCGGGHKDKDIRVFDNLINI